MYLGSRNRVPKTVFPFLHWGNGPSDMDLQYADSKTRCKCSWAGQRIDGIM